MENKHVLNKKVAITYSEYITDMLISFGFGGALVELILFMQGRL